MVTLHLFSEKQTQIPRALAWQAGLRTSKRVHLEPPTPTAEKLNSYRSSVGARRAGQARRQHSVRRPSAETDANCRAFTAWNPGGPRVSPCRRASRAAPAAPLRGGGGRGPATALRTGSGAAHRPRGEQRPQHKLRSTQPGHLLTPTVRGSSWASLWPPARAEGTGLWAGGRGL